MNYITLQAYSRLLCAGDVDPGWSLPHGPVVLVAKALTKSDTLGRVILPRVAVETNMSFLTSYRSLSLSPLLILPLAMPFLSQ